MNNAMLGTLMLLGVSVLVRVIPSIVRLPFDNRRQQTLRQLLPIAVFVNLVAYCFLSEVKTHPAEAVAAFALLLGMITFLPRVGVLLSVVLSSTVYFLMLHFGAGAHLIASI